MVSLSLIRTDPGGLVFMPRRRHLGLSKRIHCREVIHLPVDAASDIEQYFPHHQCDCRPRQLDGNHLARTPQADPCPCEESGMSRPMRLKVK